MARQRRPAPDHHRDWTSMMATADGIAARARASATAPTLLRRPMGAVLIACAALLTACGGGDPEPEPEVGPPAPTCADVPRPPACL